MKKILMFRHESWIEAPHLTSLLSELGIPYEIVKIDEGQKVPDVISDSIGGLVFLGGTMSVNDDLPWLMDELRLIKQAYRKKFPVLGHCLGSQLISKALNGKVTPMMRKEIGWHKIQFKADNIALEWQGKIPNNIEIFLWHQDEFTVPAGATPLYDSSNCKNQAFVIDNILATVAHIELTDTVLENWIKIYGYDIDANDSSVQTIEQIKDSIKDKMHQMHVFSDNFYIKWLSLVYTQEDSPNIYSELQSYIKSGSCLCKDVQFHIKRPREVVNCHCEECRKFHGNYAAFTRVKNDDIYIFGKDNIQWYQVKKGKAQRGFCKNCGSSLFWCREQDDGLCLAASALDVPTRLKTTKNIYVDYASDFYTLDDELEVYSNTMQKKSPNKLMKIC